MKTIIDLDDFCGDGYSDIVKDFMTVADMMSPSFTNFKVIVQLTADKVKSTNNAEQLLMDI